MTIVGLLLLGIKEQFPFSNFPMYSKVSEEADVVYVADQKGDPVSMRRVFKTGSGTAKKMFRTELTKLASKSGRDAETATAEERAATGKLIMDILKGRLNAKAVPEGTTGLRFYLRTFHAGETGVGEHPPELLAEVSL